jgi:hypothetical protein
MIMVYDKNDNFRIYLTAVFIETRNKKVETCEGVRKILNFHERGSWDEKVWEPLAQITYLVSARLPPLLKPFRHNADGYWSYRL